MRCSRGPTSRSECRINDRYPRFFAASLACRGARRLSSRWSSSVTKLVPSQETSLQAEFAFVDALTAAGRLSTPRGVVLGVGQPKGSGRQVVA